MIDQKLEVSNLIKPIIDSYKALNEEWDNLLDIGLTDYLIDQTDKYYFTNTFIHRGEKVEFYKIYYPIKAKFKNLSSNFNDLNKIFENYKYVTIIGSAGSGKTTLIKHIFLTSIISKFKIPVLVELRFINDYGGDLERLIFEKTLRLSVKPSERILKRALKNGRFLFLLDGYDEIISSKKMEINRQIDLFIDTNSKNSFLITTRPGSGAENFSRFHDFFVEPLSISDVENFIKKIVESEERRQRIIEIIKEQKNSGYIHYLKNPLLLSMFIVAFESHPEIPSRKSSFYRNVFDTLYSKHDGITKNSFPREKLTKLEREDFEKILNVFSYLTLIEGKIVFTNEFLTDKLSEVIQYLDIKCNIENLIYDLVTPISIIVKDGFDYNFPHRSIQEYFAAQFVSKLLDEKKKRAYGNLQESLVESSNDHSFNFWSICNELDEEGFTIFFLIPQLKNHSSLLNIDNDINLLDKYIDIIEAGLIYDNFPNRPEKEFIIYRFVNFHTQLIQYTKAYNYTKFAHFCKNPKVEDKLLKYISKTKTNGSDIKLTVPVKKILLDNGIVEIIKELKQEIDKKIQSLEIKLNEKDNKTDKLLGL